MYLFTRQTRLAPGSPVEGTGWAMKMTEKVNAVSDLDVQLWSTVFSPGLGTMSWITTVENLAQLEAADAKLAADAGFVSLVTEGATFSSGDPLNDALMQFVHMDPDVAALDAQYASVVTAELAPHHFADGVAVGVEIAQRAKAISGGPTSFGAGVTGQYGTVVWISVFESVDKLQAEGEALNADAGFVTFLDDKASDCYQAGATVQTYWRKVM